MDYFGEPIQYPSVCLDAIRMPEEERKSVIAIIKKISQS